MVSNILSTKYLFVTKDERVALEWRSLAENTLLRGSKWISSPMGQIACHLIGHKEEHSIISVILPKMHNQNLIKRTNWSIFYKIIDLQSSKVSKSCRLKNCFRLKETKDTINKCKVRLWTVWVRRVQLIDPRFQGS